MDPKASAKSKRSYSLHGRRNARPITANAQSKKPQQSGDQRSRPIQQPLPSNRDRYHEDEVVEVEGSVSVPLHPSKPLAECGETVSIKSKGADYSYLIDQARTRPFDWDAGGSTFLGSSSLDFGLSDSSMGLSPLLLARGESLLSWCGEDSFMNEDATSSFEAPFLSLDLHSLAAQLSKLSMSQRLFIEADLLPEELDVDGMNESNTVESEHSEASKSESKLGLVPQSVCGSEDAEKLAGSQINSNNIATVKEHDILESARKEIASATLCAQDMKIRITSDLNSVNQNVEGEFGESAMQFNTNSIAESHWNKTSQLETVEAEAELDMLLQLCRETETLQTTVTGHGVSSLEHVPKSTSIDTKMDDLTGEAKYFGTSSLGDSLSNYSIPLHQRNQYASGMDALSARDSLGSSVLVGTSTSIENTIDDLLAEANIFGASDTNDGLSDGSATQHQLDNWSYKGTVPLGHDHGSLGYVTTSISLDDTIDDLLAETKLIGSSGIGNEGLSINSTAALESHGTSINLGVDSPRQNPLSSKQLASTNLIDRTVDDLLAGTSSDHKDQKFNGDTQKNIALPSASHPSSNPVSGSKAIEDFDSWLDSL